MKKLLLALCLACAAAGAAIAAGPAPDAAAAVSAQEPPAAGLHKTIPYKKEETGTGAMAGQSFVIVAVLLGLVWGGFWLAKRYFPAARIKLPVFPLQPNGQRRLKLVETMRLGPRASLYLVQLDSKTVLLAQSGDNITVAAADAGASTDNKDNDVAKPL